MPVRLPVAANAVAAVIAAAGAIALAGRPLAGQQAPVGYPQRDALSPFRAPADAYAPPDEAFRLLRIMQGIADAPNAPKSFDAEGREVVADKRWEDARAQLMRVGLDA